MSHYNDSSDQQEIEVNTPPPPPKPWKWMIRLGLGLLVLGLLLSKRENATTVWQGLKVVPPWVVLLSLLGYWMGQMLSAVRWHVLLTSRGLEISYLDCCRLYLAGMFGNLFLPTSIGGDALKTFLLTKVAPKATIADAAASILMDRVTGFVALMLITVAGTIYGGAQKQAMPVLIASSILLLGFVVVLFTAKKLSTIESGPLAKLRTVSSALSYYAEPEHRGALLLAVLISLVFQASQILLNAALARAVGIHQVPVGAFFYLVPLMNLSAMIPLGIGGLGVREAFTVALLKGGGFQVAEGLAIAWSLLWYATGVLASLTGAFFLKIGDERGKSS